MNINDIAITSLDEIKAFDIVSGDYLFTLDELHSASIANSEEKQEITGKQGRKLTSLKKNKSVTISGTNGLVSGGMFALQTGGEFTEGDSQILWTDYLTVTDNAAETTYTAVGTEGAEIKAVYIRNSDYTLGKVMTQGADAADGIYTYDPATKALGFSGVNNGTEVVVYYFRKVRAQSLQNMSDKYSGKCTLYIDAMGEDKCANLYRIQFYIPKADFSGEFSLDMGDSQAVHSFEAEALAGGCGGNASLWTYTIFGANAADVA